MKVFVVCEDMGVDGLCAPEFAATTREAAQGYVDRKIAGWNAEKRSWQEPRTRDAFVVTELDCE